MLVIDDELPIRRFLRASLNPSEYKVLEAETAEGGIRAVATENPDIVLLDLGLPDGDGIDVARSLRAWTEVPIIVLSARGQESDKVAALDAGADDYLTKPFGVHELMARIRVALRHAKKEAGSEPVLELGEIRLDLAARLVFRSGEEVHLTPNEYKLLALLARHAGKVLTHRQLLREVWGEAYVDESHYLRVYIAQLRQKLEADPTQPRFLLTETGVGYRMRVD
ncbi:MAG: response regulator [Fimbriimonadaceae bacterium]|nr:response regulator [Fimbriimonadaceae bacterium]